MIESTPEIRGPGIEEEYADALQAIAELRAALGPRELINDTSDGRLLLNLQWIEQKINAWRLPIPVDRSFYSTAAYLIASRELSALPDLRGDVYDPLGRLVNVLDGTGLLKPRHVPVLIAMIDDLCADADKVRDRLNAEEREVIDDIRAQGVLLKRGEWPAQRRPQDQFFRYDTPNLDQLVDSFGHRVRGIAFPLFDRWRPYPARKPPLAAPVPGLPAQRRRCRLSWSGDCLDRNRTADPTV